MTVGVDRKGERTRLEPQLTLIRHTCADVNHALLLRNDDGHRSRAPGKGSVILYVMTTLRCGHSTVGRRDIGTLTNSDDKIRTMSRTTTTMTDKPLRQTLGLYIVGIGPQFSRHARLNAHSR
jgi:hypothetical protein